MLMNKKQRTAFYQEAADYVNAKMKVPAKPKKRKPAKKRWPKFRDPIIDSGLKFDIKPPITDKVEVKIWGAGGGGGSSGVAIAGTVHDHATSYHEGWPGPRPPSPEEQMEISRRKRALLEELRAIERARTRRRRNITTGRITEMQIWRRILRKHIDRAIVWGAYVLTGWAVLLSLIITVKLFMWLIIAILGG